MNSDIKRPLHSKLEIRFFWESAPATIKQNASRYGDDSIIGVIDFSFMSIVKGEKGDKGEKGETGDTGPQGPQGIKGDTGPIGPVGLTGPKGDTGPRGLKGETGPKGVKGEAFTYSDFTPEQISALKGEKGDTGLQGIQGVKGEKGDEGIFNFEVRDGNLILKYSNLKPQADFHINEQGQLIATIN